MEKIKLTNDHILVKDSTKQEKTSTGIIIPETHTETSLTGTVIQTNSGYYLPGTEKLTKSAVKPGQTIIYRKNAGFKLKMDDQEYRVIKEADVLVVFL
jgi:chaperonin GroES